MMVAMVKDEWVRAAMMDDSVVVELLVRLKKQTNHVVKSEAEAAAAPLRWGIRQRRSRSSRCDAVSMRRKDAADSANNSMRASPTTPLSWSGGGSGGAASPSATADEETSRHQTSAVRSKGTATNETTGNSTKRSRKKKTFAQLKEEEGFLLKERIHLNKELETLRATYKIQSAKNENLKRIKLDLGLDSGKNSSESHVDNGLASSTFPSQSAIIDLPRLEYCETNEVVPAHSSLCLLPDLNMTPAEDDSASETLYGMS
ncbi:hypothetical protein CICLE_v10009242mg [Citrus x clementina]|uniref:BZIP domain-containing protein n=1 Tax=Citrus clementina TaxID=85681 RepID=V4UH76_CITCL|nr:uncharacterized protein LOC18053806 [Citrus x clementina]ESR63575.1 hypothetical protein CICLE_v10009242mg [Citrus x clementina]